ncbi:KOW domain-containing RNA-binding protein [Desulfotruncus alcoholivorax]|uniref:KOW domain-containing RNA-binding protein n=1 Tax=Desulfotruncus alcoholivorax TaxID=265477 RepID=UPI000428DF65|nr:KOW domain-containing RNA-binding protein [Desulfotruncus alcoholivorax]
MEVKAVPGQLVESRSGRDSGRKYLVMATAGGNYVYVADGIFRRVENPKKKNIKHLILHSRIAIQVAEKIKAGQRFTNQEIRRAIQDLLEQPEEQPF